MWGEIVGTLQWGNCDVRHFGVQSCSRTMGDVLEETAMLDFTRDKSMERNCIGSDGGNSGVRRCMGQILRGNCVRHSMENNDINDICYRVNDKVAAGTLRARGLACYLSYLFLYDFTSRFSTNKCKYIPY